VTRIDLGDGYELDDDKARVDVAAVHAYLTEAYWALGRSREEVADQLRSAWRVVGAYRGGAQVGYARAVSDGHTSAHLLDVYVLPEHQGHGVGLAICREICDGAGGTELRWTLHTRDAHGLYRRLGFREPTERLLERWPDDVPR
jgi:GNAT superfamily N-acetyltransferase